MRPAKCANDFYVKKRKEDNFGALVRKFSSHIKTSSITRRLIDFTGAGWLPTTSDSNIKTAINPLGTVNKDIKPTDHVVRDERQVTSILNVRIIREPHCAA